MDDNNQNHRQNDSKIKFLKNKNEQINDTKEKIKNYSDNNQNKEKSRYGNNKNINKNEMIQNPVQSHTDYYPTNKLNLSRDNSPFYKINEDVSNKLNTFKD